MRRISLLLPVAVLLGFLLRIYPYLASGLPYSIDSWPLLRDSEQLVLHTPIPLSSKVFDGYNNYWPSTSIYGAVFSGIMGLRVAESMPLAVPMASTLTLILIYAAARRIGGLRAGVFASWIAATAFPFSFFSSGVVKEAYAYPIYMAMILGYLVGGVKLIPLEILLAAGLVPAHHLTTLIAGVSLAAMSLAELVRGVVSRDARRGLLGLLYTGVLGVIAYSYYVFYAYRGMRLPLYSSEFVSLSSYQLVFLAGALYYASRSPGRSVWPSLAVAAGTGLLLPLASSVRLMPLLPRLPPEYLLYATPFIAAAPAALQGLDHVRRRGDDALIAWLFSAVGLIVYAVFSGQPLGRGLASRLLDFLWIPLSAAAGIGVARIWRGVGGAALASILLSLMIVVGAYSTLAPIRGEKYMGYFWLYRGGEYEACSLAAELWHGVILGDAKIQSLLKGYFKADARGGYDALSNGRLSGLLVVERDVWLHGYLEAGGVLRNVEQSWAWRLNNHDARIYCGGGAVIYAE